MLLLSCERTSSADSVRTTSHPVFGQSSVGMFLAGGGEEFACLSLPGATPPRGDFLSCRINCIFTPPAWPGLQSVTSDLRQAKKVGLS